MRIVLYDKRQGEKRNGSNMVIERVQNNPGKLRRLR